MAFPILAVLAAALSEQQSQQAKQDAIVQSGRNATQNILRTRANELGGSPYAGMAEDYRAGLGDIERQAEAGRNNNIGNLLQAYLKQSPSTKNIGSSSSSLAEAVENPDWAGGDISPAALQPQEQLHKLDPWGTGPSVREEEDPLGRFSGSFLA